MARRLPARMPPTIAGFISAPTSPLSDCCTYSGAFIAHKDVCQPFEKAKRARLVSLNQSDKKSQSGPTSKAIRMNMTIKKTLA